MKINILDYLLMILAGYCVYIFSNSIFQEYFAGINHYIPEVITNLASINFGDTFHMVFASLFMGLLYSRFAPAPIVIAFLTAIVLNAHSYILLFTSDLYVDSYTYYIDNPSALMALLKPLFILPLITYLIGFIRFTETSSNKPT